MITLSAKGTWLRRRTWPLALALALAPFPAAVSAQTAGAPDPAPPPTTPTIEVIGTAPLLGSGIDRDKLPGNARSFSAPDLARTGSPNLPGALAERAASVNLNDVQASPFQPDLQYRGFDASPVLGTPQGLAVYQNGVRINEAFGDTVNWDLVPDFAVSRVNLVSSNPVFGLNALGGALALEMKDGFTAPGGEAEVSGGSFGRANAILQYGAAARGFASYIGGRALYEEGWRDHSPASLHQLYADLGAQGDAASMHLSFSGASNLINAVGPVPVELLNARRSNVFTTPQSTRNDLAMVTLTGAYALSDTLHLDAVVYSRSFRQRIANGNTSDAQPCDPAVLPGSLCFGNATTPLVAQGGTIVPDFLDGAAPGEIDRTATDAQGLGGSLQLTRTAPLLGRGNHFVAGASIDHGAVRFRGTSEVGAIEPNLLVSGSGFIIDQPDGSLAPVALDTTNTYYGLYAANTFDATERLSLTFSGRYNLALIRLTDVSGGALGGDHHFARFNPAAGVTYKLLPSLTVYAGYAEANRAPTPGELGCADPTRPCVLENFVVGDPPLKQVVARTYEAGVRGHWRLGEAGRVTGALGLFRTDSDNDIFNAPSQIPGFGFFTNIGRTRRQGIETSLAYRGSGWSVFLDYTLLDATFQSTVTLNSPNNPAADANGEITVHPGDRLPSLPLHRIKAGADYAVTEKWTLGADLVFASGQFLRGDESNQNPIIPGYTVVNLHSTYRVNDGIELFFLAQNIFDEKYATFGTFFDPAQVPSLHLADPRSVSPAPPLGVFGGVRLRF